MQRAIGGMRATHSIVIAYGLAFGIIKKMLSSGELLSDALPIVVMNE
jgi:hypothetical protein